MNNIIDIVIFAIGLYFLLATNAMKIKGKVNRFIVGRKYDVSKAKDFPGFVNYMYRKNLLIGIITLLTAVLHSMYLEWGSQVSDANIIYIVYLVLYMIYAVFLLKAQEKYLAPA